MNLAPFIIFLHLVLMVLPSSQNNTLQLCCQPTEYFDMSRYKCAAIAHDFDISWNLKIGNSTEKDDDQEEVNIWEYFNCKTNLPCEKPEALHWMNGTADLATATSNEFCFSPFYLDYSRKYVLVALDCRMELHLFLAFKHEYIYFLSGFLLIPTLIVYLLLKPLNQNLMGKCFICYLSSVIATNCFYFIIPQMLLMKYRLPNWIYMSIGLTHFYLNMVIVFWLNVLGFDAWSNFSSSFEELNSLEKRQRFRVYSIYVWTMGAITTLPTVYRNLGTIRFYCERYQQSKSCVMSTYGILYTDTYFAPAVMTILTINFLVVCLVCWKVFNIRSKFASTLYKDGYFQENLTICVRLFVLMGPQWIVIYILSDYKYIEILITALNYIESILIFILFVLKKNVLKLIFHN